LVFPALRALRAFSVDQARAESQQQIIPCSSN